MVDQAQLGAQIGDLVARLTSNKADTAARQQAAADTAAFVEKHGPFIALFDYELMANLQAALDFAGSSAREGALMALTALCKTSHNDIARACEPHMVRVLPVVLQRLSDKDSTVRNAATAAADAIVRNAIGSPESGGLSLPCILRVLYGGMSNDNKWQTVTGALKALSVCGQAASHEVAEMLPEIVPHVEECIFNINSKIRQAGMATMQVLANVVDNSDIEKLMPPVIESMADPDHVPRVIDQMSRTTFVKRITAGALAVLMFPIERALALRSGTVLRQTSVIIDNMCRLVEDPADIEPFFGRLMSGLERIVEAGANPELRATAAKAMITLYKMLREPVPEYLVTIATEDSLQPVLVDVTRLPTKRDLDQIAERLHELKLRNKVNLNADDHLLSSTRAEASKRSTVTEQQIVDCIMAALKQTKLSERTYLDDALIKDAIRYIATVFMLAIQQGSFDIPQWEHRYLAPLLGAIIAPEHAPTLSPVVYRSCLDLYGGGGTDEVDDAGDGEDLCNAEFSLAYGGKILLKKARLHLRRGHRYGLCGHNGVGKTTLMTAIAKGQLEGFPPADQLRTVLVEHDLDASDASFSVADFLKNDQRLRALGVTAADVKKALTDFDFSEEMQARAVGTLSGGWKCKLSLARAILLRADVLLLDEPTNHLDKYHVAWLTKYLINARDKTALIVSHDTAFLDEVCDYVVEYDNKKLVTYKGNLSALVKIKPSARAYFTLQESPLKFHFPRPGLLAGVGSRRKPVLRMANVSYTYPNTDRQILKNVTVACSLSSRVAVKGVNGAGKRHATLIKLLIGHLSPRPGEGSIRRHPTLRVQYVAQHAFHHVELHTEKSPTEYLRWRFEGDQDKEMLMMDTRKLSPEEEEQMQRDVVIGTGDSAQRRKIAAIIGRAKLKKSFQYEISWVGLPAKHNTWMPREDLEKLGFTKLVQTFDDKESAREGLSGFGMKSLTAAIIQKHYEDFGLEAEFSVHGRIGDLSGGQKVRVVLAAAMWLNPHLIVLDEPSNYLDVSSLGALVDGIKRYEGGVVVISHNSPFTDAISEEEWQVDNGVVTVRKLGQTNGSVSSSASSPAATDDEREVEEEDDGGLLMDIHADPAQVAADAVANGTDKPNGRASPVVKAKKLTRKQQKEEEYRKERARLAELGILPE
ncbi:translational elongation factor EF-1 alpha [Sorochytrium milnesiophthora]